LEAALNQAAEGEQTTTQEAEAHTAEAQEQTTSKEQSKTVPYERFQEVVGQKNELRSQLENVIGEKDEAVQTSNQLSKLIDEYKSSDEIVKELRGLADDEKYGPMVHALHNKIMGIEEEITEELKAEGKDVTDPEVKKFIKQQSEKVTEELEDTKAEILAAKADTLAEKWLNQLPDEYNEQDREVVALLWNQAVNWDAVGDNPDNLDAEMAKGLQETLDRYGTPRGSLLSKDEVEFVDEEKEAEQAAQHTPEAQLQALLDGKNYSGFKSVQRGDKTVDVPEVSDDEFQADFARAMKLLNSRE
jgi:hypothetical protein